MAVFSNLFGKKKKEFKAFCSLSKEPLESGYGYLLTTSQVVKSRRYWDSIMTEPETMSYTINHFTKQDNTATQIRSMIFQKYSEVNKPWMVSDSYINWFNVDLEMAKERAKMWWAKEGDFSPENSGTAENTLSEELYAEIKQYAIMEAGRDKVNAA